MSYKESETIGVTNVHAYMSITCLDGDIDIRVCRQRNASIYG